ncbi:hypothetical protein O181_019113 [Austropuccinia psidii MF-1]|uniref:Uncharacterized protein n=1 Tax=Austropuccinia psidii MF-1 TaxID=1389203 RepID=A0A9Q3CAC1_9BASI|nr:hypothetical protein [Austropuccinia psidii MF-1]
MIQALEEKVRQFCAYSLELKDCDRFTHYLCTLLTALELTYKTFINASTNKTSHNLEKGWNPRLPHNSLRKDLDKSHATPDFKVGDLILVSITSFNNIKGCKNLKDPFSGPFFIKDLHRENAVEAELSEELSNKNSKFKVILIKTYQSGDAENFLLRNEVPQKVPPVEPSSVKKITKALKERKLRTKKVIEYLVRYSDPTCGYEWLEEKDLP